ncbi:MAG: transcription-repair coupling factor [Verrucomicrobiota bacterium]|jgi:transcription-repair coupling factor (superfamily II helicase)|nr:transcription-repair coupling factor [Verrucomicrobiota bacterium]
MEKKKANVNSAPPMDGKGGAGGSAALSVPPPSPADRAFLKEAFQPGGKRMIRGLEEGARAWLALVASRAAKGLVVVVAESSRALDLLAQDLTALGAGETILRLPALNNEASRLASGLAAPEVAGERLHALHRCMAWKGRGILVTCIQAMLEPVPAPEEMKRMGEHVAVGREYDLDTLSERLAGSGYEFEAEVLARGQATRRGGLLDVWPLTEDLPARLEFFGDTLESIRLFDPSVQRSLENIRMLEIPPATMETEFSKQVAVESYFPKDASFVWLDPDGLLHHYAMSVELSGREVAKTDARQAAIWQEFTNWRLTLEKGFSGGHLDVGGTEDGLVRELGVRPYEGLPPLSEQSIPPDVLEKERRKLFEGLQTRTAEGWRIHLFFGAAAAARRFTAVYGELPGAEIHSHTLSGGFEVPGAKWMAVAESDFYGTRKNAPTRRKARGRAAAITDATGERLTDWSDLRPGELVVHVDHGIGNYLGLYEIVFDGQLQEVLAVEYAGGARLYVPTSQTHLLSRYVGVGRSKPQLHTLGAARWLKEKVAAERAASDLAAQMLETQAKRAALDGHAFAKDHPWQYDFEQAFPYSETADQLHAIEEVKRDMESTRPMDRLICGDTGYGKTEVAMRAAFKAVMDGKQVAVLVPTTVLAQQHYETFIERMGRFPVTIEVVSRFRSQVEQAEVLARTAQKKVDVLIGTHRLVQPDVRFADLGLVIIDEEQRFGVAAKEHLKRMREMVDVLTLSATPIPRTLYLSLTGARDMSVIQTPPRERLAIETYIAQDSDELIRDAILREVNRGGQVFFLHNRVQSIQWMKKRLEALVPDIRIGVGHGQMSERALADVMHRFVRGDYDLLLCTTIIESGVDIPNVNTILIDRADRFGMADLYQLRGRVGRSKNQAYAYLLLPRHGHLFATARQRISAIRRHSSLGAGFKLALRDLEIRGAGNVLGAAQSGHIAAVGFDLYCQLLDRTVARLKGEVPRPVIEVQVHFDFLDLTPDPEREEKAAVIPRGYVEDENLRIGIYRKLAGISFENEVGALEEELRDRFGLPPAPVRRLLTIARLRVVAAALGLRSIATDGDRLLLGRRRHEFLMPGGRHIRLHRHGADDRLAEIEKRLRQLLNGEKQRDGRRNKG